MAALDRLLNPGFHISVDNGCLEAPGVGDHLVDPFPRPITFHPIRQSQDTGYFATFAALTLVNSDNLQHPTWSTLQEPTASPEPDETDQLCSETSYIPQRLRNTEKGPELRQAPLFLPSPCPSPQQTPFPKCLAELRVSRDCPGPVADPIEMRLSQPVSDLSTSQTSSNTLCPPVAQKQPQQRSQESYEMPGPNLRLSASKQSKKPIGPSQPSQDVSDNLWNFKHAKESMGNRAHMHMSANDAEVLRYNLRFILGHRVTSMGPAALMALSTPPIDGQNPNENYTQRMEWFGSSEQFNQNGKRVRRPRHDDSATPPPAKNNNSRSSSVLGKHLRSEELANSRHGPKKSRLDSAGSESNIKVKTKDIEKWTHMFHTLVKGKTCLSLADIFQLKEILDNITRNSHDWQWVSRNSFMDEKGILHKFYQTLARVTKLEAIPHSDQVDLAHGAAKVVNIWQDIARSKA
ncbi:hypothetical protein C8J56DRAFT_1157701 [Mycena floridula]|nr:hypothetical protein C8J56DRAFT_1157701 [Mycena floridula]